MTFQAIQRRCRVVVADASSPFVRDKADDALATLLAELRRQGHDAERVALPYSGEKTRLLSQACAWRMLNLSNSNAQPVDVVIATRFPAWFLRHPHKVAWLIADDDLRSGFRPAPPGAVADDGRGLDQRLALLDSQMLRECRHVFAASPTMVQALAETAGVDARLLQAPTEQLEQPEKTKGRPPAWDEIIQLLLG